MHYPDLTRKGLYLFPEMLISSGTVVHLTVCLGDSMAKFMLSLRDENFKLLMTEVEERGITAQVLIWAVIIPDWVKISTPVSSNGNRHGEKLRSSQAVRLARGRPRT